MIYGVYDLMNIKSVVAGSLLGAAFLVPSLTYEAVSQQEAKKTRG
jgi:hypothetical protein